MDNIDIISLIKEDKKGDVKYWSVNNLYYRIKLFVVFFILSLIIMDMYNDYNEYEYNVEAPSGLWILLIDLVALLLFLLSIGLRIDKNKKLKNKYPHAFTKLANGCGVKLKQNGYPPLAHIFSFAGWDELTYSCIEELECYNADPSYPLSPLSYNKYFGGKTEYFNKYKGISDTINNIGKWCGIIMVVLIVILSIAAWIEYGKFIVGLGIFFGLGLVLSIPFLLIEYLIRKRFMNNPTIMSSIATMEGIDIERILDSSKRLSDKEQLNLLLVEKKLFTAPLIIIKPFKEKYISLLERYPNGIQVFLKHLSEECHYRETLVTEKKNKGHITTEVLEAKRLLCNLLDSNTFRIILQILRNEDKIRIYEANYAKANADDKFIDFANRTYDNAIIFYSERLPEWNIEVSKINYSRYNYDGSQSDVELRLIDIYYTDMDSDITLTDYQQRIETTKKLLLGQLENRIAAFCDSITGFHTIVFNDDREQENGHLLIGKMIVTTLKKYEPRIRPYLVLNNIDGLDDVLTKHTENVIFNIDHYLQDECDGMLQSVIQDRFYVIGIHNKSRQRHDKVCCIKSNSINSLEYLSGQLPYLYLYSYIPVRYENENDFRLTKSEFYYRSKIFCFKGIGIDHSVKTDRVYNDLKLLLTESFDGLENVMFFFVPSKTHHDYQSRHKKLNELLMKDFHATTSYHFVRYLMDGRSSRDHLDFKPAELYWGECFFKGKQIIMFDDIITSGHTMLYYQKMLEGWGAKVIACVALGKTHYSHIPHPIDELKDSSNKGEKINWDHFDPLADYF